MAVGESTRRSDPASSPGSRLAQLGQVLRLPELPRAADALADGAQVEALLARLSALTRVVRARADVAAWDEIDALTARLLLSDLALIAADLRALTRATRDQLAGGIADLDACRNLLAQPDDLPPDV